MQAVISGDLTVDFLINCIIINMCLQNIEVIL